MRSLAPFIIFFPGLSWIFFLLEKSDGGEKISDKRSSLCYHARRLCRDTVGVIRVEISWRNNKMPRESVSDGDENGRRWK